MLYRKISHSRGAEGNKKSEQKTSTFDVVKHAAIIVISYILVKKNIWKVCHHFLKMDCFNDLTIAIEKLSYMCFNNIGPKIPFYIPNQTNKHQL